jgi:hypothetical protein
MLEVTTESGRVYRIDLDESFWFRSPHFVPHRIWGLKAGTEKVWPHEKPEVWEDRMPVVGEHLYVASRDEWWVSNRIVSIEPCEYPERPSRNADSGTHANSDTASDIAIDDDF